MEEQKIDIELRPEVARGVYSNLAIITHSTSEFILDFVQMMPGLPKPSVNSRVLMTPENAKRLLKALMDNVQKYESQFGEIKFRDQNSFIPPFGGSGGKA